MKDAKRPIGLPLAALGVALLASSLFMPWYRVPTEIEFAGGGGGAEAVTRTLSGWVVFRRTDLLLALVAAYGAALCVMHLVGWRPGLRTRLASLLPVAAGILLVARRILSLPVEIHQYEVFSSESTRVEYGTIVALVAVTLIGTGLSLLPFSPPGKPASRPSVS